MPPRKPLLAWAFAIATLLAIASSTNAELGLPGAFVHAAIDVMLWRVHNPTEWPGWVEPLITWPVYFVAVYRVLNVVKQRV
jgi:hypothetical protein